DEVRHLIGVSVLPPFVEQGHGPALGIGRFFHGVSVAALAVGEHGAAAHQVAIDHAVGAVDFERVLDAAALGPAILDEANGAALEFDDAGGIIFALGAAGMHVGIHRSYNRFYFRLAQDPPRALRPVAAHVKKGAAARALHVPKPGGVGAEVLLELPDVEH